MFLHAHSSVANEFRNIFSKAPVPKVSSTANEGFKHIVHRHFDQ